ncbi:hypothetical protein DWW96_10910 [Eubacterium sp. AF17-7]|uniref:PcfJ domain-containing protein n=1 Tax=Eubacterium sp. AF17-7 TaxID=2293105 RepID=UPI000E4CE6FD|nr:PcfJ domain-containing protein [Eubacterium sp. AF17-7]RGG63444.1 hypothetical protein DWW96_10910 [Eubacterium sp. AF17-7]
MKKAKVEAAAPVRTQKNGWWLTAQVIDEDILVLNIYKNKILQARHCINVETGEYATLNGQIWSTTKIERALGYGYGTGYYYYDDSKLSKRARMSKEDKELIERLIVPEYHYVHSTIDAISKKEAEYSCKCRLNAEERRINRVMKTMRKVPDIPQGIKKWIDIKENNGQDYMLKDRDTGKWTCTACTGESEREELFTTDGKKPKDKDIVICPHCKNRVKLLTRKLHVDLTTHFMLIQYIDDEMSVARHFKARIYYIPGNHKQIEIEEEIRIILFKKSERKEDCSIYYEQYGRPTSIVERERHEGNFDNKGNPQNKKTYQCYLYEDGIEEALKDTAYEKWMGLFNQMAAAGIKANYNSLMVTKNDLNLIKLVEMLFKGRFSQLLAETSGNISYWTRAYCGPLKLAGHNIEDVFEISDRQKINRIREKNGGELMLKWMRWSDSDEQKISDKAMSWILKNKISITEIAEMISKMSIEKAMNYVERQKKEQYKKESIKQIISQYADYINMCGRLHKDLTDEMIFKPRELKRRHDEAVEEIERLNEQLIAEEYSERFSEAEEVLKEIKNKYEYEKDEFFIKVPEKIVDIVREGRYLHHCVGTSDRYLDRIKQHETYIVFLRKKKEPDTPFYTIEVEPGGTIRQHRGMYDEEPEIELVKPFLKNWQKVIRRQMSKKDYARAAISKNKREENIAELREKNNTRVLKGLEEDFMEAI